MRPSGESFPQPTVRPNLNVAPHDTRRIAGGNGSSGDIIEDHGACADDALIADRHAGQYQASTTDETSRSNVNGLIFTADWVEGVYQCLESDQGLGPDDNRSALVRLETTRQRRLEADISLYAKPEA